MKNIYFKSDEFIPSLAMVNSVVLSKNSLPILSDVRIETKEDGFGGVCAELTTSDSETWLKMKTTVYSNTDVGVVICVDCKALLQALRNLEGKPVTMEINKEKHIIKCEYGNGHFSLPYENADEFPIPVSVTDNVKSKSIDAQKLLTAIEKAGFATANDELRPIMNGVHFDFLPNCMVSVASDGHKLAKYSDLTIVSNENETDGFTMPKKPCSTLLNVLSSTIAGDVDVMFNERCFVVGNSQFKMTARLIEGRYPNYNSVIPKNNNIEVIINRSNFISALKRVLPMGDTTSELVMLKFEYGSMAVSTENIDFSKSASENIVCDYKQEQMAIGFKGSVLLQLLQNIETANVKMILKDPCSSVVICEDKPNTVYEYTSIIMPMLIQ